MLASVEIVIGTYVLFLSANTDAPLAGDACIVASAAPASFATDADQDRPIANDGVPPAIVEEIVTSPAPASFATDADQDPD